MQPFHTFSITSETSDRSTIKREISPSNNLKTNPELDQLMQKHVGTRRVKNCSSPNRTRPVQIKVSKIRTVDHKPTLVLSKGTEINKFDSLSCFPPSRDSDEFKQEHVDGVGPGQEVGRVRIQRNVEAERWTGSQEELKRSRRKEREEAETKWFNPSARQRLQFTSSKQRNMQISLPVLW